MTQAATTNTTATSPPTYRTPLELLNNAVAKHPNWQTQQPRNLTVGLPTTPTRYLVDPGYAFGYLNLPNEDNYTYDGYIECRTCGHWDFHLLTIDQVNIDPLVDDGFDIDHSIDLVIDGIGDRLDTLTRDIADRVREHNQRRHGHQVDGGHR